MATFSNCLQIVNAMPQRDQDALLARLDELQAQGMSPKEAQLQAAIDVLAQVEREGDIRKSASRVTDTPEFKRWFGDSKVVDENGEPLVVYHGSRYNADIKKFSMSKSEQSASERGIYFTDSTEHADQYSSQWGDAGPEDGGSIYPVYLKIENPYVSNAWAWNMGTDITPAQARLRGHDGYVIENHEGGTTYIVFKPTQIKSAIGNRGQFDPNNPDIRKSSDRITNSANFKRWSGGAPVIELGDKHEFRSGQPVVVEALHGTTNADLTEFKRERANIESDMGAGFYASNTPEDVARNYANVDGPDLTQRVELLAERLEEDFDGDMDAAREEARKRLSEGAPNTLKLYVRFKNPAVLGGRGETYLDFNEAFDEETEEYGEATGLLVDFVDALRSIAPGFNASDRDVETTVDKLFASSDGEGISASEAHDIIKNELMDAYDDEGGNATNEIFRQALSQIGFDGVIDTTVYGKFGPRMIKGAYRPMKVDGMGGMTPDTVHFIAFEPEQIKSAIGNSGEFGENRQILKSVPRPQFYSQLQRAIEGVPERLANMAAPAWKQWLTANAPKLGVSSSEVARSGLVDYLGAVDGKIAKADVGRLVEWAADVDASGITQPDDIIKQVKDFFDGRKTASETFNAVVNSGVVPALDNDQVVQTVVERLPVDVVDMLADKGISAEEFARNPEVLRGKLSSDGGLRVATDGLVDALSQTGALIRARLDAAREAGLDLEVLPALTASDLETRVAAGVFLPELGFGVKQVAGGRGGVELSRADLGAKNGSRPVLGVGGERGAAAAASFSRFHKQIVAQSVGDVDNVTDKMRETVGAGVPLFSKDRSYVTEDEISKMYTKAWGDLKTDEKYIDLSKAVEDAEKASNDRFQKVHKRAIEILKSRPGFSKIADEYDEKTIGNLARVFMDQADKDVPPASPSVQDALRARQEYVDYYFKEVAKIPEPREFSAQANQQRDYYDSPAFKRWFKDSKVVNAQGKPLVAFHVTSNDFAEFDTAAGAKAGRKTTAAYSGQLGSWFTAPSLYDGNYEAGNAEAAIEGFIEGNDGAFVDGANTMPVHLSIQNPMEYSDFESMLEDRDSYKNIAAYKKDLVDQGYDGIVIRNSDTDGGVDRDDWVAFEPTQIKSAIGNSGEFDPTNPDIRKSAARPYFDDLAKLKITTNYQLGDLLKTSKKLSWWDRTVGTQYNLAQKHPEFKRVFDAVQTFINDVSAYATRAADMAQDILPKLETWRDIGKAPLSAADVKALRDPIFGGTLSYTRDEEGNIVETDDVQKAGVVFTDEELRSRFNLTDKQIDLYRQFRKATDQSITDLALSDMLRYLGEDGADIREQVMASGNVDVAVGIIKSHLEDLAASEPRRAYLLGNITSDIEDKAEQANRLMDRGYAPLSRFGQYTVYAVGQDGEQIYFSMFENERDANKMAREMREQYPDATVTTGTMSQESYKLFSGVTPETLALFGEALGLEESGIDTKSEAYQTMLKVAKTNRSAMKRLIQRKGIDGFSEDAGRVLAGFVYSNARQISTNLHAGEIGKAASDVKDGDVKDQAVRLMEYIQNPTEEAQKLKGLLFTTFLGGNISSALVNLTQTATTTFPYLSQFDSAASVTKRLGSAAKMAWRGIRNDDELKQALKRAEDEGVVSPQEVFHLMAQAQGKAQLQSGDGTRVGDALAKVNNFMTKATLGWGRLFSVAEQANRRIAFIAAYQLARDKGMENPFAFAEKAVLETQFSTNKGIRPQWARGAVGGVLFTFKGFTIAYLELLARMLGNGPEGKKAFALALGTLFLFAGAGGLPGVDDLDDVVDGFMQRVLGKSFDSKQKKKEFFASIFGQTGAEFVMGGLTSLPGAPIDLSGRLGLGNIVPGTGFIPKKANYQRDAMEVFGPAGSLFSNYAAAVGSLAQGDVGTAAKTAAPLGLQNLIKGMDMAQMGFYRDTRGRKVIDTNGWEAFAKTLGFSPASVKRIQDATVTQQGLIAQNRLAWQEIRDLAIAGRIERDQDKVIEARRRFEDWNRKNPDSPLEWNQQSINKGVQEANKTKAQRIAAAAPKQIRESVKQELERAN